MKIEMEKKMEVRTLAGALKAGEGRTISGYAIVWNVESCVLASWDGEFVEVIERGAVDDALIAQSDVKALFNHCDSMLLARSVNGKGTLKLSIDDHGLRFEFEAPNTSLGNDVLELVKRGDLQGCSFAFTADEEHIEYMRKDGMKKRVVRKLNGLYDVSVVVNPAYTQTSVDVRSFDVEVKDEDHEPPKQRVMSAELAALQAEVRKMEIEIL